MGGTAGIGVDGSGRVHALFDGWPDIFDPGFSVRYATCAGDCHTAANWTFTDVAGGEDAIGLTSADTSTTLMVDADGSLAFVSAGFNDLAEWEVKYFECAGACSSLTNWTMAGAFVGYPVEAERDAAGTTHVLFHADPFSEYALRYARCASDCLNPANWELSTGSFPIFAGPSLAVTASGRVFVGYLHGEDAPTNPRRFIVRSCADQVCADLTSWTSSPVGVDWEGWDGSDLVTAGDEVMLVTTSSEELRARACASACHVPGAFGEPTVIDHNVEVGAVVNPVLHAETDLCDSAEPNWWTQIPVAAMTADRTLVVHRPYGTYVCTPDNVIYDLASVGRVLANF